MKLELPLIALTLVACGTPDGMETREEFDIRMEQAERTRQEAAARRQQAEIEVSLRNAAEQNEIRVAAEAAAAAAIGLDIEVGGEGEGEAEPPEEVKLDEVWALCGRTNPRCLTRALEGRARDSEALELLAEAYAQIGDTRSERRTRQRLHARLVFERTP